MYKKCEANSRKKQVDFLVASLIDFFRDPKNEQRFSNASKIACNQVLRMTSTSSLTFEKRYRYFASKLKNNVTAVSLRIFADECVSYAEKMGALESVENKPIVSVRNLEKKALKELSQSLASGHSEGSAVFRAANELIKLEKRTKNEERILAMTKSHPLGETLEVLKVAHHRLAKEDIRHHLLRLPRKTVAKRGEGVLFGLLDRAKAFATIRLHGLLGDDLFFLCRPVGFVDKDASTVLIEVPTSAHLYALTYRKLEILNALKKDSHFSSTRKLQFRVTGQAF